MAAALAEQTKMPDIAELAFEERLGLLVDRELTEREEPAPHQPLRGPNSSTMPPSKTSITVTPEVWINP